MRIRPAAIGAVAAVALLLGGLPTGLSPADAADASSRKRAVDRQVKALRAELAETSARLAGAGAALARVSAELPLAQQAVAEARSRLVLARDRDAELAAQLSVAVAEVAKAESELAATLSSMAASRTAIGQIARLSYQSGDLGALAVVLQTQSPADLAVRLSLSQTAIRSQGSALAALADTRADNANAQARLEAKREHVAAMKAEQERVVTEMGRLESEAVAAEARVQELIVAQRRAVAAAEAERSSEQRRINEMEAESARLQSILTARANAARGSAGPSRSGGLAHPVSGSVSSPFGFRVHPITGTRRMHTGTDFRGGMGTPIYAAAGGEVVRAGPAGGYGNQIVIDHGRVNGVHLATSYSHQSRLAARRGETVRAGELIGYIGSTGFSTGPHLHFEVYVEGRVVDPMRWL